MIEEPLTKAPDMTDWSEVVQQHGPIVWKTAYRLLNHEADAADCFQNTLVSAWELSRRETVRNWAGLLRRLATARAIERLRQRRREADRLTGLPEACVATGKEAMPGLAAEADELAEHVRDALADMDARQAEVFCLACLEDMAYREIAERLGLTVDHVGVLLHRAKTTLRERLGAHSPSPTTLRSEEEILP
jgi:RNA polymerase sigma-70 factor (ECF subfamily)